MTKLVLLKAVYDAGGREDTETLYNLVEQHRPTVDEDGEPIGDLEPYETAREEIGALERVGLLKHDEDGMASFGYSSLTEKGQAAMKEYTSLSMQALNLILND